MHMTELDSGNSAYFNEDVAWRRLVPGEIHVVVAHVMGPPDPRGMQVDSVGSDLATLLEGQSIRQSSRRPGLSTLELTFFKRGQRWTVSSYLRAPVSASDHQRLLTLLRSLRFPPGLVSNAAWAESLAWQELPESARLSSEEHGWPVVSLVNQLAQVGQRSVLVESRQNGYEVTFRDAAVTWKYFVSSTGGVRAM